MTAHGTSVGAAPKLRLDEIGDPAEEDADRRGQAGKIEHGQRAARDSARRTG